MCNFLKGSNDIFEICSAYPYKFLLFVTDGAIASDERNAHISMCMCIEDLQSNKYLF